MIRRFRNRRELARLERDHDTTMLVKVTLRAVAYKRRADSLAEELAAAHLVLQTIGSIADAETPDELSVATERAVMAWRVWSQQA